MQPIRSGKPRRIVPGGLGILCYNTQINRRPAVRVHILNHVILIQQYGVYRKRTADPRGCVLHIGRYNITIL